jgi:hypothetical protein
LANFLNDRRVRVGTPGKAIHAIRGNFEAHIDPPTTPPAQFR